MPRLFALTALALFSTSAFANTPDGETPAVETVCDIYDGAAYGLCVAYCEAMDCEDDHNADQTACDRVAENFEKKTGEFLTCEDEPPCTEEGGCEPPVGEK